MILIIFDLDGTLLNSQASVLPAVQEALDSVGLPPSEDEFILSLMGENTPNFSKKLLSTYGQEGLKKTDDFLQALWIAEEKHIESHGRLFKGIPDILERLSARGHTLAICSNATSEYIRHVLETQGIMEYFDLIKSADDMGDKSEGIKDLIASAGYSRAIMIGDRYHDLEAAKENSIQFIGALYGYGKDEISEAEFLAETPNDIIYILEEPLDDNKR